MRRFLFAFLLLAAGLFAQASEPFFFIQGSDPQLGYYTSNKDFQQETANFEFFVASVNRLKPAFVVLTGDFTMRSRHPEQMAEFKRIADKLDKSIPLYLVPGNHDTSDRVEAMHLEAWRKNYGPDYWAFQKGSTLFVGLNSALLHWPNAPAGEVEKQYAWLERELERGKAEGVKRVIVFQHHPWFIKSIGEADQYGSIPAAQRKKYFELFRAYGVTHIFAGHLHRNVSASADGIDMITTGALGMPRGEDRSGFRVVMVRDSGVTHTYYDFGSIPNRISLQ